MCSDKHLQSEIFLEATEFSFSIYNSFGKTDLVLNLINEYFYQELERWWDLELKLYLMKCLR